MHASVETALDFRLQPRSVWHEDPPLRERRRMTLAPHHLDDSHRRALVRLCATISGDASMAEDLAQETLLEAWRIGDRLTDADGLDRWLAAIARNVCRRWARRRATLPRLASEASLVGIAEEVAASASADLIHAALALLPVEARGVLVERDLLELPVNEIAARRRLSPEAVSMRLIRARSLLRRVIESNLLDDAVALGLVDAAAAGWQPTGAWCRSCGRHRLDMRTADATIAFRCAECEGTDGTPATVFRLANAQFSRLLGAGIRPSALLRRAETWSHAYYTCAAASGIAACTACEAPAAIKTYRREELPVAAPGSIGLSVSCAACGEQVTSSIAGLALAHPALVEFRRAHPRTVARGPRELGWQSLAVRCEEPGGIGLDVVFDRETLRLVDVGHAAS
jgi:RNA polymerase sigma-70 factor (ECF subfamily)